VGDIVQFQNIVNQETENFSYASEALTQVNDNQRLPDENDFMEFWRKIIRTTTSKVKESRIHV
jgi:hypothetical protein